MAFSPRPNPLTIVLSCLYGAVVAVRQTLYRRGIFSIQKLPVPVIVVGNVLVGGVGKTPFCIQLIQHLQALGYHPGLVTRGYKRQSKAVFEAGPSTNATQVGDEGQLIWQQTGAPVVAAANRVQAAHTLLQQHPEVDIVLSDDGLQHYALARDIEVVLQDERIENRPYLLPAGWLREPWPRRRRVGCAVEISLLSPQRHLNVSQLPQASSYAAVAGIGRPDRFFNALQAHKIDLAKTLALPDHDAFEKGGIFDRWQSSLAPEWPLLCTEKDAIKITAQYPQLLKKLYPVGLRLDIPPEVFAQIEALLNQRT